MGNGSGGVAAMDQLLSPNQDPLSHFSPLISLNLSHHRADRRVWQVELACDVRGIRLQRVWEECKIEQMISSVLTSYIFTVHTTQQMLCNMIMSYFSSSPPSRQCLPVIRNGCLDRSSSAPQGPYELCMLINRQSKVTDVRLSYSVVAK